MRNHAQQQAVFAYLENTESGFYACASADCSMVGIVKIVPFFPLHGSEAQEEDESELEKEMQLDWERSQTQPHDD